jgi:hypothetical protein
MEGRKENNRATYKTKKIHEAKNNEYKAKNNQTDEFSCFKDMSPEVLYNFMANKYDDISYKNTDNIVKMNHAIIDRLINFRREF